MILNEGLLDSPSDSEREEDAGNPGMADALRKVLQMGKNMGKSTVVLAKAKLLTDPKPISKPAGPGFEITDDSGTALAEPVTTNDTLPSSHNDDDEKPDSKSLLKLRKLRKFECVSKGRLKPSPVDREKERPLVKIATRGVVQLFNAVREQQKFISKKIEEEGHTEVKKDKVLKSINKRTFLDVLRGQANNKKRASPEPEIKTEEEDNANDDTANWGVLREDFMMGARLKDWNKDNDEEQPKEKRSKRKEAS